MLYLPFFKLDLSAAQTTCGADGKIIVWDVTGSEPKEEKVIGGVIPADADSEYTSRTVTPLYAAL